MSKPSYVRIDADKIRTFCVKNNTNPTEISRALYRSDDYLNGALRKGKMQSRVFEQLCSVCGVDPSEFQPETKQHRAQLVLRESTWANAQKIATMRQYSFNELVSKLLEKCIDESGDVLAKYDRAFGRGEC